VEDRASFETENSPPTRQERRIVLGGLMLALTLAALDQNIVATALPRIVSDLGGLAHLSWVFTAFLVASTTSTPLYGKFSDIYGRKPAFMVSIIIFLLGSVLCGLAQEMMQLILFRAIQGLGAGGLITLAQTTIGDLVSPRQRGRYQGLFAAVFAGCSVAGPLLGGFITNVLSWRWIFYVNLPVGAVALVLIAVGPRRHGHAGTHRIDYAGALLLIAATCCALLVLSWGGSVYPWSSTPILIIGAAAVLLYAALALVEVRAPEPVLPLHLFTNRVFVVGVTVISLSAMALFTAVVFLPLFFQLVLGASPADAGLMISPMMGGVICASFLGGRLVSKTGRYKRFPVAGLAAATSAYLAMSWAAARGTAAVWIEVVLVVMGLGIGFVMPNLTTAIQNAVARRDLGAATSASAFLRSLGGALGVALSGAILTTRLHGAASIASGDTQDLDHIAHLPSAQHAAVVAIYAHALSDTFLAGAAIAGCAFLLVLFLPEHPLRSSDVEPATLSFRRWRRRDRGER
jgi:EmrB/QacA subfamily drug resistance transporter